MCKYYSDSHIVQWMPVSRSPLPPLPVSFLLLLIVFHHSWFQFGRVSASEFYCSICGTSIVKLYVFFCFCLFYYDSVSFTCVAHSNMVGNCMWRRVQNSEKLFILIFVTFFSLNFIISYLWSHLQSPGLLLSVSVSQIHFGIPQQNVNIKDPSLNSSSSTSSNCGAACSR